MVGSDERDEPDERDGAGLGFGKTSKNKVLASFNNCEAACNMLCGKGRVRTQDLGYQAERYDHYATRPVARQARRGAGEEESKGTRERDEVTREKVEERSGGDVKTYGKRERI